MSNEQIFAILFAALFVFILIREVICWYFKINERVQLQKDAIKNQEDIISLLNLNNHYLEETQKDRNYKY